MPNVLLSTPPEKPTNWWRTIPGQLAIVAMLGGLVLILCALFGAIGPPVVVARR
jgi:hypothetical protein